MKKGISEFINFIEELRLPFPSMLYTTRDGINLNSSNKQDGSNEKSLFDEPEFLHELKLKDFSSSPKNIAAKLRQGEKK